jgi:hypothetical protein
MATGKSYQDLFDRIAALRQELSSRLGPELSANPQLADAFSQRIDGLLGEIYNKERSGPLPPDKGLAGLAGIGPEAATDFGQTRVPPGVEAYDDQVTSERMVAVADLYYFYQHEKIGVFRVVQKLKELFNAGAVRLSRGDGAFHLYQFDRREVLRYTKRERRAAYRRAFGYGNAELMPGARTNTEFHPLFTNFNNQVALFWRDKRISDVMRTGAFDPSFGSIAIVRRSGLDLRNNLKYTSFGHLNVMRVELMQLLEEAFKILNASDVKSLFGADNAWDVVEEMLSRYFNEPLVTSPRQRMAVTGREVLRWLAQGHILKQQRAQFEALLLEIAEPAEEWITSAQSLGLTTRSEKLGATGPGDRARARFRAAKHANGSGGHVRRVAQRERFGI